MRPDVTTLKSKLAEKCDIEPKIRFKDYAHPLSDDFVGRKFELTYEDDQEKLEEILAVEFLDEYTLNWWGVEGPLKGHSQSEAYMLFKIREQVYLLNWYEQAAPAVHGERWGNAGYLMAIIFDMGKMAATDCYTNPMPEGNDGTQFIMAQCSIKEIT